MHCKLDGPLNVLLNDKILESLPPPPLSLQTLYLHNQSITTRRNRTKKKAKGMNSVNTNFTITAIERLQHKNMIFSFPPPPSFFVTINTLPLYNAYLPYTLGPSQSYSSPGKFSINLVDCSQIADQNS